MIVNGDVVAPNAAPGFWTCLATNNRTMNSADTRWADEPLTLPPLAVWYSIPLSR